MIMRNHLTQRSAYGAPCRSRGVAAVEFVIAVPLLLFMMLFAAEVGRAYIHYDKLSYAVRNGARFVSEHAIDGTTGVIDVGDVREAAQRLVVYGKVGGSTDSALPELKLGDIDVIDAGDNNIAVSATYAYRPMFTKALPGILSGSGLTVPMHVNVTMRAIS